MTSVTPIVALCIFIIVVIIAVAIAFLSNPDKHEKTRTRVFLTTLTGLGIIITFMFYYNVVELQQEQQLTTILEQTNSLNESILETLLVEIRKASTVAPHFTLSLLPLSECAQCDSGEDPQTPEVRLECYIVSYKIFSIWQNFLEGSYFLRTPLEGYLTNFLQRAHSKPLHDMWLLYKHDFGDRTQLFGDMLFEKSSLITENVSESYAKCAAEIVNDRKFKVLLRV